MTSYILQKCRFLLTSCITICLSIECFTTGELLLPAIAPLSMTLIIAIHLAFMCKLRKTTINQHMENVKVQKRD